MEWEQIVLAFIGGSVVTAVLTVTHARAERFRDRMLDAAERFLAARDEAVSSLWDACGAGDEALKAQREAREHTERAAAEIRERELDGEAEAPDEFAACAHALAEIRSAEFMLDLANPQELDQFGRVVERFDEAVQGLIEYKGEPDLEAVAGRLIEAFRGHRRYVTAGRRARDAVDSSHTAMRRVGAARARLNLLFAQEGDVLTRAQATSDALGTVSVAMKDAFKARRPLTKDEAVLDQFAAARAATDTFATAVHERIRRWWRL